MKFHSINHHKSSTLETFASNLSALKYILEFRKSHRKVFNFILIAIVVSVIVMIALYMSVLLPRSQSQSQRAPVGAYQQTPVDIHQPTDVNTENYIEHIRTEDGFFKSTVKYEFGTAFLLDEGFREGDICSLRINIVYRGKSGDLKATEDNLLPSIVVGNYVSVTSIILDADGFVSVDDIVGYNIK